jgi:hypothetical protein
MRLLELIDDADIFQLFWSKPPPSRSMCVRKYQYALALRQKGVKGPVFIRPIPGKNRCRCRPAKSWPSCTST